MSKPAAAGVVERADVVPRAERDRRLRGGGLARVAVQPQAVEAVAQQDVGLAVAVVVDPGGGGQVVARLLRQQVAVVAEARLAEVGEQLRPGRRGQQQVGLAVAVVVGPDGGAAAGRRRAALTSLSASPSFCSSDDAAGADQAEVGLAVAVEVDGGDRLGVGIDARQSRRCA